MDRRAFWHGPAFKHASHFEAEIVVEAPCRVLLNDEQATAARAEPAERFGRSLGVTFLSIIFKQPRLIHAYPFAGALLPGLDFF